MLEEVAFSQQVLHLNSILSSISSPKVPYILFPPSAELKLNYVISCERSNQMQAYRLTKPNSISQKYIQKMKLLMTGFPVEELANTQH